MSPSALPVNVFISYASEDAHLAIQFAESLEQRRYSTWYYQRDTLPGVSYLEQCSQAIQGADAILLLISKASLASHEVATEVELAHRRPGENRYVPILVKVAYTEIQKRRPIWQTVLGTATAMSLESEPPDVMAARVAKSLKHWNIQPRLPAGTKIGPKSRTPVIPGKWASDANQIDIEDLKDIVFRNEVIHEFLEGHGKYFLSANKGLGKTLLLTCKRSILTHAAGRSQLFFNPEGRPYLDFMADIPQQSANHEAFLSDLANAKRLWALSLRIATLSCHSKLMDKHDADDLKLLPRALARWLKGEKVEPTVVFKEVLGYSLSDINRLLNEKMNFLEQKFRAIHSPTYLFIDKVDQGIQSLKRTAWIHVQAGLIEAAWDAMSANNHVKIYASIRQEAFSNYRSPIRTNLHGATTVIQYSDTDLQDLLDRLTSYYEKCKTFKELIKLNAVRHPFAAFPEDSFTFLNRHTLGRPRDLVILASEFSRSQKTLTEPIYRKLVSNTSATVLVANVFEEMRVFLDCLQDEEERFRFLALLPHNILTREEAVRIAFEFNGLPAEGADGFSLNSKDVHHPFWELYSAGLLGVVVKDSDDGRAVQRFKLPHDTIGDTPAALPNIDFCLIHPALDGLIKKHRYSGEYHLFRHIIVGHDCTWEPHFGDLHGLERMLFREADDELRERVHGLLKEISPLLGRDKRPELRTMLAESAAWQALNERLAQTPEAELTRCLKGMLPGG